MHTHAHTCTCTMVGGQMKGTGTVYISCVPWLAGLHACTPGSFIFYHSTSQLYHGLQRVYRLVAFVQLYVFLRAPPSGRHTTALGLQIPYTLEAHDTTITCIIHTHVHIHCTCPAHTIHMNTSILYNSMYTHNNKHTQYYMHCIYNLNKD